MLKKNVQNVVLKIQKFFRDSFVKNAILISRGTLFGHLLVIITTPVLTRMYNPQEFGELSIFIAIISILTPLATLRLELAVPIAENDTIAIELVVISILTNISIVVTLSVILFCIYCFIYWYCGTIIHLSSFALIPIALLFTSSFETLLSFAVRVKAFKKISQTRLIQSSATSSTQIALNLFHASRFGLILGYIIGFVAISIQMGSLVFEQTLKSMGRIQFRGILSEIKKNKGFVSFSMPATVLSNVGVFSIPIFIGWIYGSEIVGYYALSVKIVSIPLVIIGLAFSNVFFSYAAELIRKKPEDYYDLFRKTSGKLLLIGVVSLLILCFGTSFFIVDLLGEKWVKTGEYVIYMFPGFLGQFVIIPLSNSLNLIDKQKIQLGLDAVKVISICAIFLICFMEGIGDVNMIIIYSVTIAVTSVISFAVYRHTILKFISSIVSSR